MDGWMDFSSFTAPSEKCCQAYYVFSPFTSTARICFSSAFLRSYRVTQEISLFSSLAELHKTAARSLVFVRAARREFLCPKITRKGERNMVGKKKNGKFVNKLKLY